MNIFSQCFSLMRITIRRRHQYWNTFSISTLIRVNGTSYHLPKPQTPIVGICIDGSAEAYTDEAKKHGYMPTFQKWASTQAPTSTSHTLHSSGYALVTAVMPTFTNPNNVGIATGTTPNVHGISGNYFFDQHTQKEVKMNSADYLRVPTIFSSMEAAGVKIIVVTTKHKLLNLLSAKLDPKRSIFISIEQSDTDQCHQHLQQHGIHGGISSLIESAVSDVYDPLASISCLQAGQRLIQHHQKIHPNVPCLVYLSTTDFVQHQWAPGDINANAFYKHIDVALKEIDDTGAAIGVTADHGMNDKINPDGSPRVIFLQTELKSVCPAGVRVILPITDPYLVHHAGLGSFATLYLNDSSEFDRCVHHLRRTPGIYTVLGNRDASRELELPRDRIGDIVVVSDRHSVFGRSAQNHDIQGVTNLRSHGCFDEMMVPMVFNRPVRQTHSAKFHSGLVRNFHLYEMLCNGIEVS